MSTKYLKREMKKKEQNNLINNNSVNKRKMLCGQKEKEMKTNESRLFLGAIPKHTRRSRSEHIFFTVFPLILNVCQSQSKKNVSLDYDHLH